MVNSQHGFAVILVMTTIKTVFEELKVSNLLKYYQNERDLTEQDDMGFEI